ncbi:AIPR family protein [Peribacillus simplex]|uniref:AIPR family protein n=1 Tax=Peribacillus simplex TaxID=1478 RepID=UPI003670AAA2
MSKTLLEFAEDIQQQTINMAEFEGEESFREDQLTQLFIDYLCELGELDEGMVCSYRGRGMQVNGFSYSVEMDKFYLFITGYFAFSPPTFVRKSEIDVAKKRAIKFLEKSLNGLYTSMEEASPAFDIALQIYESKLTLKSIEIIYFTDGLAKNEVNEILAINNIELTFKVWDIQRLYRSWSSGRKREVIEIDLEDHGSLIHYLPMPQENPDYKTYLAIFPGEVLVSIYSRYGPRLLERNVRSFLQARGKVNKGIRKTIKTEPHMFLAYNNGLSAVAESLEFETLSNGKSAIKKITDMQIVNGGQTTASIYHAFKKDKVDLKELFVQVKLTIVLDSEKINEMVPRISEYANNQNKIQTADFSANDPFHVKVEELSRTIWAPSIKGLQRQTRWFYERARGQYMDEKGRAKTPAQKKQFEMINPKHQLFTKTDLAKFENTWEQLPYIVSLGAQKNFNEFTINLKENTQMSIPDKGYFEKLVAKSILFRRTEKLVQEQKYGGYRANIVTYTLSWLSFRTEKRIDLDKIWKLQELSPILEQTIILVSQYAHQHIINAPGNGNVTEWCKKVDCWEKFKTYKIELSDSFYAELCDEFQNYSNQTDDKVIEDIAKVKEQIWFDIVAWSKETNSLLPWQRSLALSLGKLSMQSKSPTLKQALHGQMILRDVRLLGYFPSIDS